MITNPQEYISRLSDIQNEAETRELVMLPSDEPRFLVDANKRTITTPDEFTFLSISNDHKAETIYFEIDRYYDKVDLSAHTCIIQYMVTDKNGISISEGIFPVTKIDIDTVPGKIMFGWEVHNDVTAKAGLVDFSIRFYSIEEIDGQKVYSYNFNTLFASLPVKETCQIAITS